MSGAEPRFTCFSVPSVRPQLPTYRSSLPSPADKEFLANTCPPWITRWLPDPKGPFPSYLRIYWPEEAALDGSWMVPEMEIVK